MRKLNIFNRLTCKKNLSKGINGQSSNPNFSFFLFINTNAKQTKSYKVKVVLVQAKSIALAIALTRNYRKNHLQLGMIINILIYYIEDHSYCLLPFTNLIALQHSQDNKSGQVEWEGKILHIFFFPFQLFSPDIMYSFTIKISPHNFLGPVLISHHPAMFST